MAQLIVRNLDSAVVAALRQRAAQRGKSMEAEHREILRAALGPASESGQIKQLLLEMPDCGSDEDFARRPSRARRVRL